MSQDLFAAFGDFSTTPAPPETGRPAIQPAIHSTPQVPVQIQVDDDDDFGDFEDAAVSSTQPAVSELQYDSSTRNAQEHAVTTTRPAVIQPKPQPRLPFSPKPAAQQGHESKIGRHPFADHMDVLFSADDDEYSAGQDEWNDLSNDPEAAMAYSKRVIQEQLDAEARTKAQTPVPSTLAAPKKSQPQTQAKPRDPAVLFDAEDLSEDEAPEVKDGDDWGDFEDFSPVANPTVPSKQTQPASIAATTASMDLLGLDDPLPPAPKSTAPPAVQARGRSQPEAVISTPASMNDDPWDDFDAMSQQPSALPTTFAPEKPRVSPAATVLTIPPTNIPPPSVILSVLSSTLKQEATPDVVPNLISTSWVSAHVLAGRKSRWKRSTTLAASMRIGPAAAGGKSGMKLTGVDRGEVAKEDREVAELLTIWRAHVGKLRSAVASYNNTVAAHNMSAQRLPELAAAMPVKALKPMEGGFSAPHECALCGLKREERIVKIDDNIEDSFGEWWMEQASMHKTCADWWVENELTLRSR